MNVTNMRLYHKFLFLPISTFIALLLTPIQASSAAPSRFLEQEEVRTFIRDLETQEHFDKADLEELFSRTRHVQSVIDAMDRPFKQPPPWYKYAQPILTEARYNQGVVFWNTHRRALEQAESQFGVPAQIIVAIIGVETFYGKVTGNYRLMDALSTLAFDYPRRASFFQDELKQFLILARDEHINPLDLRGSFAGAMGIPQFMPSSYRRFGIDYNQDGHIDLLRSPVDAIGSVGHFLKEHGWERNSWGVRPIEKLPIELLIIATQEKGISEWKLPEEWERLFKTSDNQSVALPFNDREKVALLRLEMDENTPYFVWVGPNFQAITKYNRSRLYASVVWSLACQLAEAEGKQPCDLPLNTQPASSKK